MPRYVNAPSKTSRPRWLRVTPTGRCSGHDRSQLAGNVRYVAKYASGGICPRAMPMYVTMQGLGVEDVVVVAGELHRGAVGQRSRARVLGRRIDPEAPADHAGPRPAEHPARLVPRKALAAILVNQGLRPTGGGGGPAVLLVAVRAQLHPPSASTWHQFDWMRRTRNDSEYPTADAPVASREDLDEALPAAGRIIEIATRVLPTMPVF
jgi:hypothetical protein